jgi:serine/threonine protein phosphatase 1
MQTFVIGDIHGCYAELQALLDRAGLSDTDRIISIGDCVDRGPETPEVLRFFSEHAQAQVIMGNHERKHVRAARHEVKLSRSQQISRIQLGAAYPDALAFMSGLPLYLDLPDALLVHGYFEPSIPIEQQTPSVLCGTMGGDKHLHTHYGQPWYELYDGDKPIVVGHKNYTGTGQPFIYQDRVFGLDTDCVIGKALTGLLLPAFRFISASSRGNLWMQVKQMHPKPARTIQPKPILVAWSEADDTRLHDFIAQVSQTSAAILHELQSDPTYADLRPREQARLFGQQAGTDRLATLLHLARVGKLNTEVARQILKAPAELDVMIKQLHSSSVR